MSMEILTAGALRGLRHGFFTRAGGVSGGVWASLNCGPGSDDDPAAVAENLRRVAEAMDVSRVARVRQVHSARAVAAEDWETPPEADAVVTDRPGLALGVLTADCAPVLLADRGAGVVGAAHAGWRGALGGVLAAAVAAMERLGADRARTVAAVGPCISQAHYEVGPEFLDAFLAEDPEAHRFFAGGPNGRPMFDLPGWCLARLRGMGLSAEWIGRCTYADPDRFHSHRRMRHAGEADYGRLASVVVCAGPA